MIRIITNSTFETGTKILQPIYPKPYSSRRNHNGLFPQLVAQANWKAICQQY
jgi:hypothetical protein